MGAFYKMLALLAAAACAYALLAPPVIGWIVASNWRSPALAGAIVDLTDPHRIDFASVTSSAINGKDCVADPARFDVDPGPAFGLGAASDARPSATPEGEVLGGETPEAAPEFNDLEPSRVEPLCAEPWPERWTLQVIREPLELQRGVWRSQARDRWKVVIASPAERDSADPDLVAPDRVMPSEVVLESQSYIFHHWFGPRAMARVVVMSPDESPAHAHAGLASALADLIRQAEPVIEARVGLRGTLTSQVSFSPVRLRFAALGGAISAGPFEVLETGPTTVQMALADDDRLFAATSESLRLTPSEVGLSTASTPQLNPLLTARSAAPYVHVDDAGLSLRLRDAAATFGERSPGIDLALRLTLADLSWVASQDPGSTGLAGEDVAMKTSKGVASPSIATAGELQGLQVDLLSAVQQDRRDLQLRVALGGAEIVSRAFVSSSMGSAQDADEHEFDASSSRTSAATRQPDVDSRGVSDARVADDRRRFEMGPSRLRLEARRLDAHMAAVVVQDAVSRLRMFDSADGNQPKSGLAEITSADDETFANVLTAARWIEFWQASALRGAAIEGVAELNGPFVMRAQRLADDASRRKSRRATESIAKELDSAAPKWAAPGLGQSRSVTQVRLQAQVVGTPEQVRLRPLETLEVRLGVALPIAAGDDDEARAATGREASEALSTAEESEASMELHDPATPVLRPTAPWWPWPMDWWSYDDDAASIMLHLRDEQLVVAPYRRDHAGMRALSVDRRNADPDAHEAETVDRTGEWLGWWFERGGGMF